ncbi:uncharacterized protein LOC114269381 [Camellia sinensis]|uniref:uncharacterized protein LOC114269381 n=1 Tax=Camellia sinensis TaxID=4442 RepID=UPI00103592FB|nr:uncharacterized protein LOC114269381 [Camellia sinensis]
MHLAFSTKELGFLSYFLGIFVQTHSHGLSLSQQKYAGKLLLKAGLVDCKPCFTPLAAHPSITPTDTLPFSQPSFYRSLVGGLQYLTITRLDLGLAVNQACQHMQAPANGHFAQVKCLLRYVKGILHYGLSFSPGPFLLQAFTDSNWASDCLDRRSTSGFCVYLGPYLLSWSVKKQPTVSRSSTEAEYRSMAYTTAELCWIQ